ncbi:MAG TPA: alpha/beta hydrolase [Symbiobacteriaceae bacterium]|nr:alpha/beta hydrolase [Symbiobacteriaceae bacterium]
MQERWIENQGVRLQVLESGSEGTPLLFVPGTPGPAADFAPDMEALAPRRTLAVSLRGAVPSDAPVSGYRLEDFASDVGAVAEGLERPCLVGFSIAVPYVLAWAADQPDHVGGLVLIDYPARYPSFSPEWAERVVASAPPEFFRPNVVRGVQRDSVATELWDRLGRITCPVLILRGGQGSRLSDADLACYRSALPQAEVIAFRESGHDVRRPHRDRFQAALAAFVDRL